MLPSPWWTRCASGRSQKAEEIERKWRKIALFFSHPIAQSNSQRNHVKSWVVKESEMPRTAILVVDLPHLLGSATTSQGESVPLASTSVPRRLLTRSNRGALLNRESEVRVLGIAVHSVMVDGDREIIASASFDK